MDIIGSRLNILKTYKTESAGMYLIDTYKTLLNDEYMEHIIENMQRLRIVKIKCTIGIIKRNGFFVQEFEQEETEPIKIEGKLEHLDDTGGGVMLKTNFSENPSFGLKGLKFRANLKGMELTKGSINQTMLTEG